MAHINELPWHIYTNFHDTFGVISRHTLKQLYNHMLTSTYNTTLYYKLNTHVVRHDGPWLGQQQNCPQTHWRVPSGTIKRRLNTILRSHAYMWHSTSGAKVNRLQNAKCWVQKKRVVCNYITIYRTHIPQCTHKRSSDTQSLTMYTPTHTNIHTRYYTTRDRQQQTSLPHLYFL